MPYQRHFTLLVTSQHRHFQLYHYEGGHLLPFQLLGEHTGHMAASRHSEPIWNVHIPPIALIAGTSLHLPRKGWKDESTHGVQHSWVLSHITLWGNAGRMVTHPCINWAHDCLTSVIKHKTFAPCYVSPILRRKGDQLWVKVINYGLIRWAKVIKYDLIRWAKVIKYYLIRWAKVIKYDVKWSK